MNSFFITGTDTGIGKTWVTLYLMRTLQSSGIRVVGMKPIATGATRTSDGWVNEDALTLQRMGSIPLLYEQVNPYVFEPPVSPNIAATIFGKKIELEKIKNVFCEVQDKSDSVLVEGIGGWMVPLNDKEYVADLALTLGIPIILVVGIRIGCINHAILTYQSILSRPVQYAGWVANHLIPEWSYIRKTIETLTVLLKEGPLYEVPYGDVV